MPRAIIVGAVVCLGLAVSAQAGLDIQVGTHVLQPKLAGQNIGIYVTGGDQVYNVNLHAQVADGGPAHGGSISGPMFTNVDLFASGTIFELNNNGRASGTPNGIISPQVAYEGTATTSGTVGADGLLAIITFDTTGYDVGSWDFLLTGGLSGNTDFGAVPVTVTNGRIIVPEPTSLFLILLGAGLITSRRRRNRHSR